jgi:hypothetical protein
MRVASAHEIQRSDLIVHYVLCSTKWLLKPETSALYGVLSQACIMSQAVSEGLNK